MAAIAPRDRIAPQDFYRQLDLLRESWPISDEYAMTKRLDRLMRMFEHLPAEHFVPASDLLHELGRDRLAASAPYRERILKLVEIVRTWDGKRPPLLACPECGIELRGHRALSTHRYVVHDIEDDA